MPLDIAAMARAQAQAEKGRLEREKRKAEKVTNRGTLNTKPSSQEERERKIKKHEQSEELDHLDRVIKAMIIKRAKLQAEEEIMRRGKEAMDKFESNIAGRDKPIKPYLDRETCERLAGEAIIRNEKADRYKNVSETTKKAPEWLIWTTLENSVPYMTNHDWNMDNDELIMDLYTKMTDPKQPTKDGKGFKRIVLQKLQPGGDWEAKDRSEKVSLIRAAARNEIHDIQAAVNEYKATHTSIDEKFNTDESSNSLEGEIAGAYDMDETEQGEDTGAYSTDNEDDEQYDEGAETVGEEEQNEQIVDPDDAMNEIFLGEDQDENLEIEIAEAQSQVESLQDRVTETKLRIDELEQKCLDFEDQDLENTKEYHETYHEMRVLQKNTLPELEKKLQFKKDKVTKLSSERRIENSDISPEKIREWKEMFDQMDEIQKGEVAKMIKYRKYSIKPHIAQLLLEILGVHKRSANASTETKSDVNQIKPLLEDLDIEQPYSISSGKMKDKNGKRYDSISMIFDNGSEALACKKSKVFPEIEHIFKSYGFKFERVHGDKIQFGRM